MAVLFYLAFVFATIVIYVPLGLAQEFGEISVPVAMASEVVADCVLAFCSL